MGSSIDNPRRHSYGPWVFAPPLLVSFGTAFVIGLVASRTEMEPYETPFFHLFFSDILHMKAWLTTTAFLLGVCQVLTAANIYGTLRLWPKGKLNSLLHRWSGRAAVLLTLPSAYHCIFKLGFGTYDLRALIHSLLGTFFYGVFFAKVLIIRTEGYPGWVLPLAGGFLFTILTALWLTSAYWFFSIFGLGL
jgi:hypothetical protein